MTTASTIYPVRDERLAEGRGKRSGETYYTIPGTALISTATFAPSTGTDYYAGWIATAPIIVDQLAFEVTTGVSGNARCGFYRANRDWQPYGAPMADSGDVSVTTNGIKTFTPGTPILVRPGRYLSVFNTSSGITLRIFQGQNPSHIATAMGTSSWARGWRVTRAYAAFPTPGTAWDTVTNSSSSTYNFVVYRLSAP